MSAVITSTDYTALGLEELSFAIMRENGCAIRTAKTAVDHAIRCGEMLIAAKAKVPHGGWESWVTTETEISLRTASRYMQSAVKSATLADLDPDLVIAEALEMIATPETSPVSVKKAKPPRPAATVTMEAEVMEPPPSITLEPEHDDAALRLADEHGVTPAEVIQAGKFHKASVRLLALENKIDDGISKLKSEGMILPTLLVMIPHLTKAEIKSLIETLNTRWT